MKREQQVAQVDPDRVLRDHSLQLSILWQHKSRCLAFKEGGHYVEGGNNHKSQAALLSHEVHDSSLKCNFKEFCHSRSKLVNKSKQRFTREEKGRKNKNK